MYFHHTHVHVAWADKGAVLDIEEDVKKESKTFFDTMNAKRQVHVSVHLYILMTRTSKKQLSGIFH